MTDIDYLLAIILGVVQGATEFLPVSSSGHLAVLQHWFGLEADRPAMLLFDVLAHLGTLVAVLIVFARPFASYLRRFTAECRPSWKRRRYAWRITLLGVAACVPTAAIALTFKDRFEAAFANHNLIGLCLIITGVVLACSALCLRTHRGWRDFRWWQAALVGVAQALAILPGISRSGSTICVATFFGLRRRWAGEFSFLIAAPAIGGAVLLKVKETFELSPEELATIPWGPIAAGSVVSFIVGVFALKILLGVVRRAKLHYFAIYCWIVGALIISGIL